MRLSKITPWLLFSVLLAIAIVCCPPLDGFKILPRCERNFHAWHYAEDCTRVCSICGLVNSQTVSHSFKLDYSTPCVLKRICKRCGYIENVSNNPYAKHEYVLIKADICTSVYVYSCNLCGFTTQELRNPHATHQYEVTNSYGCTLTYTCSVCCTHSIVSNHNWVYAKCGAPMYCSLCYIKYPSAFQHVYSESKCGEYSYCLYCGAESEDIQEHSNSDYHYFTFCKACGELTFHKQPIISSFCIILFIVTLTIWTKRKRYFEGATIFIPILPPGQDHLSQWKHHQLIYLNFHDKFSTE